MQLLINTLSVIGVLGLLASCDQNDGPAEQAGESLDNAAQQTSQALEETGDQVEDFADESVNRLEDACEEIAENNC